MHIFKLVAAATLLMPTVGLAQDDNAEPSANAKAWLVSNFRLVIKGVAARDGHTYLDVQSSADIDEDGVLDEGIVRLQCAGGELRAAHYTVKSPRDSASGMASGERMHKPFTLIKEWGAATPQLRSMRIGYEIGKDVREVTDGWDRLSLSNADGLCAAVQNAKVTKTRSNIQNN